MSISYENPGPAPEETTGGPRPSAAVRFFATFISVVFHPLFIPTVMVFTLYKLAPVTFAAVPREIFVRWLAMVAINTLLLPLVLVFLLQRLGFIESIRMPRLKDRIIPLIGSMTFYFWAWQVAKGVQMPFVMNVLLLGNFLGIVLLFLVSIFYKVSMHTTAAGGILGIVIVLMILNPINMQLPLFAALLIAGLVGTARLALRAHTPGQIWLGYLIGLLAEIAAYLYLL
jgi:hypothetical protein